MRLPEAVEARMQGAMRFGILLDVKQDGKKYIIHIAQKDIPTLHIMTHTQLKYRAIDIFQEIPIEDFKITTEVYKFDSDKIDYRYINSAMSELGIERNDIIAHFQMEHSTMSVLLTGKRELTRWQKVAFYHYFLQKRIRESL